MEQSIYQWALASRELSEQLGLTDVATLPALIWIWLALECLHELLAWIQLLRDRKHSRAS